MIVHTHREWLAAVSEDLAKVDERVSSEDEVATGAIQIAKVSMSASSYLAGAEEARGYQVVGEVSVQEYVFLDNPSLRLRKHGVVETCYYN